MERKRRKREENWGTRRASNDAKGLTWVAGEWSFPALELFPTEAPARGAEQELPGIFGASVFSCESSLSFTRHELRVFRPSGLLGRHYQKWVSGRRAAVNRRYRVFGQRSPTWGQVVRAEFGRAGRHELKSDKAKARPGASRQEARFHGGKKEKGAGSLRGIWALTSIGDRTTRGKILELGKRPG